MDSFAIVSTFVTADICAVAMKTIRIHITCVGDLGRGGPGEMGRSIWLELASGLSGGLSSSGGDGVLASRSGPESLRDAK